MALAVNLRLCYAIRHLAGEVIDARVIVSGGDMEGRASEDEVVYDHANIQRKFGQEARLRLIYTSLI